MTKPIRVLLTGAGSPGAPSIIKSLRSAKDFRLYLIGMDCNQDAVGFQMVDEYFVCPRAAEHAFIPTLFQECKDRKIDVILSLVSDELELLSQHQVEFKQNGTNICLANHNMIREVRNKGRLFECLKQKGLQVPDFYVVNTVDQLKSAIHALGYPHQTVCFKPTISDGSRGFHILNTKRNRANLLFYEKPNSVYLSESELWDILEGHSEIPELVVMEYLPYEEYSVDILAEHGKVLIAIPRLRVSTVGGVSTSGIVVNEEDVIKYTTSIISELNLHGNIGIQVKRDIYRNPKIVEINPRMQGTIVLCRAAGVNLPFLAIKQALGIPIQNEELKVSWGTRMIRYWDEVYFHADGSPHAL